MNEEERQAFVFILFDSIKYRTVCVSGHVNSFAHVETEIFSFFIAEMTNCKLIFTEAEWIEISVLDFVVNEPF